MYKAYCDGACRGNPGPGGWGCVIYDDRNRKLTISGKSKDKRTTNNIMEYVAVLEVVKKIPENSEITIYSDSKLVVNQLSGNWKINNSILRDLNNTIKTIIKNKRLKVTYEYIPRSQNTEANDLAQLEAVTNKRELMA